DGDVRRGGRLPARGLSAGARADADPHGRVRSFHPPDDQRRTQRTARLYPLRGPPRRGPHRPIGRRHPHARSRRAVPHDHRAHRRRRQITRRKLTPATGPGEPAAGPAGSDAATPAGMPNMAGMTKMLSYLPFMTAVIAAVVPLAAALYLLTTTSWTLGERLVLNRKYLPAT